MDKKISISLILIITLLTGKVEAQDNKISYKELVNRLTNLKALAILPEEGEESAMWSSYDRKSKVVNGEYINWAANDDGLTPQYIRKEGENMVLAEMEGPGAVVRIWSASPKKGHVKIFIDGKEVPVMDMPFRDYFRNSAIPAFNYPQLVYETAARGFNNYVPIPYQHSMKIVAEPGWGQYYHFNYISFPEGTKVESFQPNPTSENAEALAEVNSFFENKMGKLPYSVDDSEVKEISRIIAPGDSTVISLKGEKAIYALKANVHVTDDERMAEALRKLVLRINWDGEKEASVWTPIGDFFGSAPGYNLYKTLPMGMTEDTMYSYWYMPFEESAEISLVNNYDEPVQVDLSIGLEKLQESEKDYGRFHAKWHRNILPLENPARWPDWTILETEGRGRYLGASLMVWNPKGGSCRQYGGPGYWWWGEGDAKFFVDGETFPSTYGTGTEDYFGYAWCIPDYFTRAFHSQSHSDNNMGYQSVNRWQIIDNVPFQESFNGYIEKYFPDKWPTQYAVTTYWYLNEEGKDPIGPTPAEELYGWEIPYTVYAEPNVIEGENLNIKKNSGGYATTEAFVHEKLFDQISGHRTLLWHAQPEAGTALVVGFNFMRKPGEYKLTAQVAKSPQGGKFKVFLNGEPAGTIDLKS
ncbi:MAG TPA: glycoside hydrolase family 172 protein, partial [Salinimicrobium sp.]|nr:glycoside hydrolase family 172 protein [Salinimicrobium sp.]